MHYYVLMVVAFCLMGAESLRAQSPAPNDSAAGRIAGNWRWTFVMPDGSTSEPRVKLRVEGGALSGVSMPRSGEDHAITNGVIDGERVSWSVIRILDGRTVTTHYRGRAQGDTLTGEIESDWSGALKRYDWTARRESDSPAGKWRWASGFGRGRAGNGGGGGNNRADTTAVLSLDGHRLSGTVSAFGTDTPIQNGTFEKGEVRFELVREIRERKTVTLFRGKLDGDILKGETESDFGGQVRKRDWEAARVVDDSKTP